MVSFCSFQISFPNTCTVLIFFIAGLLFLCLEHVEHWERIASRWRPAFSSHLISRVIGNLKSTWWSRDVARWVRCGLSVTGPFVCRCLTSLALLPFPHPAHRTGRADLPHPALGEDSHNRRSHCM